MTSSAPAPLRGNIHQSPSNPTNMYDATNVCCSYFHQVLVTGEADLRINDNPDIYILIPNYFILSR
jgi:hypothetical protein